LDHNSVLRLDASVLLLDRAGEGGDRATLDERSSLLDLLLEALLAIRVVAEEDAVNALHQIARESASGLGERHAPRAVIFDLARLKLETAGLLDEGNEVLLGLANEDIVIWARNEGIYAGGEILSDGFALLRDILLKL